MLWPDVLHEKRKHIYLIKTLCKYIKCLADELKYDCAH